MEKQSLLDRLRKALAAIVSFVSANAILSFVLFLVLIFFAFFAVPAQLEHDRLTRENTLMRELLRPDCSGDSTGR